MPDLPISGLTGGNPAQSADIIPVDRSGSTFGVTAGSIAALVSSTLGSANPFWWMLWDGSNYSFSNSGNGTYGTGTANQVKFTMIRVPYPITLTSMTTRVLTTSGGAFGSCGIYSTSGNKLGSWDNFSLAAVNPPTVSKTGGGSLVLQNGVYIAACSCTNNSAAASLGGFQAAGTNEGVEPWNTNGTARTGLAANPMSAGIMPATLGTLTVGGAGLVTLPCILLEP